MIIVEYSIEGKVIHTTEYRDITSAVSDAKTYEYGYDYTITNKEDDGDGEIIIKEYRIRDDRNNRNSDINRLCNYMNWKTALCRHHVRLLDIHIKRIKSIIEKRCYRTRDINKYNRCISLIADKRADRGVYTGIIMAFKAAEKYMDDGYGQ
jgi:hypothetical protein